MEIEKTRETSWRIQLKKRNENIEITSVEISGEVRLIKLALLRNEKSIRVEMNKEEFFNFLSLISAFKDVVIGEETVRIEDEPHLMENEPQKLEDVSDINNTIYPINTESLENNFKESDNDELNPEEWDPW
ncbi:MAG: hypothetical protein KAX18_12535 [Candidatus Lokiarchaeota archaeon]|jgi:hypothetical protein|nr:hypothetical protein [Candidatus Lokiarchaeota archaeon]